MGFSVILRVGPLPVGLGQDGDHFLKRTVTVQSLEQSLTLQIVRGKQPQVI